MRCLQTSGRFVGSRRCHCLRTICNQSNLGREPRPGPSTLICRQTSLNQKMANSRTLPPLIRLRLNTFFIAHAPHSRMSTSGLKSDVTIVLLNQSFSDSAVNTADIEYKKQIATVMGKGNFRPPYETETPERISMKLGTTLLCWAYDYIRNSLHCNKACCYRRTCDNSNVNEHTHKYTLALYSAGLYNTEKLVAVLL